MGSRVVVFMGFNELGAPVNHHFLKETTWDVKLVTSHRRLLLFFSQHPILVGLGAPPLIKNPLKSLKLKLLKTKVEATQECGRTSHT